jgi:AcrR family transcriptional regulator
MSSVSERQPDPSVLPLKRRGRPPACSLDERRQLILQAAERVFIASGYGAASMEEIARAAGMSKKTVYALYPDKRHLFSALIGDAGEFLQSNTISTRDPAKILQELRRRLLATAEFALSPRQIEITRLVISEAHHWPELAEEFHVRGLSRGLAFIAECLEHLRNANPDVDILDVQQTAAALCGAAIGDFHFRILLEKGLIYPRDQLLAQVDIALKIVLPSGRARATRRPET